MGKELTMHNDRIEACPHAWERVYDRTGEPIGHVCRDCHRFREGDAP